MWWDVVCYEHLDTLLTHWTASHILNNSLVWTNTIALHCNILQYIDIFCNVSHYFAMSLNILHYFAISYKILLLPCIVGRTYIYQTTDLSSPTTSTIARVLYCNAEITPYKKCQVLQSQLEVLKKDGTWDCPISPRAISVSNIFHIKIMQACILHSIIRWNSFKKV